jgi:hypothetical protein
MSFQEKYDATTPKEEIGHVEYEQTRDEGLARLGVQTLKQGDVSFWLPVFLFFSAGQNRPESPLADNPVASPIV